MTMGGNLGKALSFSAGNCTRRRLVGMCGVVHVELFVPVVCLCCGWKQMDVHSLSASE